MKVLVIGALGQLGHDVCNAYQDANLIAADIDDVNIADRDSVFGYVVETVKPDVVVNTAAFHNVPKCEEEPAQAYLVNATGCRNLGQACSEIGARIIHISTDYVFGNGATKPLVETDMPAPLSTYGASKLAGEYQLAAECDDALVVRTAAIYGTAPCRAKGGKNFVDLMLHLAETRDEVKVVTDEITSPTYTGALAQQLRAMAEKAEPGLYHVTCQDSCSWYEFAKAIFEATNTDVVLKEATSEDFPSPVKRPDYSVLENRHLQTLGIDIMPHWRDGLGQYLKAKAEAARTE